MTGDAPALAPRPLAVLGYFLADDGRPLLAFSSTDAGGHSATDASALLAIASDGRIAAAAKAALDRIEQGGAVIGEALDLEYPPGSGRTVPWRLDGLRDPGGRALVMLVAGEPQAVPGPGSSDAKRPLRSAILRADLAADGQVRFVFVDRGIGQLTELDEAAFAASPPGRAIAGRVRDLYALRDWGPDLSLNDLAVESFDPGAPPLQCRLFRGRDSRGRVFVGLVLHDHPTTSASAGPPPGAVDDLLRLLRVSAILLEDPPLRHGLAAIAAEIGDIPRVRSVTIALIQAGQLVVRATAGPAPPLAEDVAQRAITTKRIVHDVASDDGHWILAVPIEAGTAMVGVLELRSATWPQASPWMLEVIGSLADYIAAFLTDSKARPRTLQRSIPGRDELDLAVLLTPRQQEVLLAFVDTGHANRELAALLRLAESTVKVHMKEIMRRLGVDSRSEALHTVFRRAPRWLAASRRRHRQNGGSEPTS